MKLKKGFSLHELGDEHIVIHDGTTNVNFDKLLSLNPTAAYLWEAADERGEVEAEELARLLTSAYEVSYEQALADAEAFVRMLVEAGVAE